MKRIALVVLFSLLVCTACDGAAREAGDDVLTKAEFRERVDAICADRSNALEGLAPPENLEESAVFLRRLLPVIRDQVARIRALGEPPEDGAQAYLEWFEAREGVVETTADMIDAAEDGDAARFQGLATVQQELDEKADEAAATYGFEVCGRSGEEAFSEDGS